MGCDIHLFIEAREKETNSDWFLINPYMHDSLDSRNYQFFAALAGVRGEGPDPKGIPDDASPGYLYHNDQYDVDAHSHSYYSLDEFLDIYKDNAFDKVDIACSKMNRDNISAQEQHLLNIYEKPREYLTDWANDKNYEFRVMFFFDN